MNFPCPNCARNEQEKYTLEHIILRLEENVAKNAVDEQEKKDLEERVKVVEKLYEPVEAQVNRGKAEVQQEFDNFRVESERREAEWYKEKSEMLCQVFNTNKQFREQRLESLEKENSWNEERIKMIRGIQIIRETMNDVMGRHENHILTLIEVQNQKVSKLEHLLQALSFQLFEAHVQLSNAEARESRAQTRNEELIQVIQSQESKNLEFQQLLEINEINYLESLKKLEDSFQERVKNVTTLQMQLAERESEQATYSKLFEGSLQEQTKNIVTLQEHLTASESERLKNLKHIEVLSQKQNIYVPNLQ